MTFLWHWWMSPSCILSIMNFKWVLDRVHILRYLWLFTGAEDDVHHFSGNDTHTDYFRLVLRDGESLLVGGRWVFPILLTLRILFRDGLVPLWCLFLMTLTTRLEFIENLLLLLGSAFVVKIAVKVLSRSNSLYYFDILLVVWVKLKRFIVFLRLPYF